MKTQASGETCVNFTLTVLSAFPNINLCAIQTKQMPMLAEITMERTKIKCIWKYTLSSSVVMPSHMKQIFERLLQLFGYFFYFMDIVLETSGILI